MKLEQLQPGPAVVDGGRVAEGLPDYFPAPGRVRHGTLAYFALRSVFAELDGRRSPAIEHLDAALSAAGRQSPQQRAWLLALTRFWLAQALPEPTRSRLEEVVEDQLDDVLSMVTLARTLERSAPRLRRRLLARAKREAETPDEKLLLATDVKERIMLEFHAARSRDPASLGRVYLSAQLLGNEELMESSLKKLREIEWTSDLASAAETLEWGGAGTASAELLRRAVERAKVPDSLYPVIRFTANRALTELAETAFAQGLTLCEDVDAALGLLELAEEAGLDLNRALAAAVRLVDAADRVEELGQVARRLRDGSLRELLKQDQLDLASAVSAIGGERSSEVKARRPPPGFLRYFGLQVDTDFTFHRDAVDYAFASGATARSLDYSGAFLGVKLEIPVLGVRYAVDIIDESPSVSQTDGGGGRSTILELDSVNLIRLKPLIDGEDIWVRHHDSAGKKGLWMLLAGNRYRHATLVEPGYSFEEHLVMALLVIGVKSQRETFFSETEQLEIETLKVGFSMREMYRGAMTDLALLIGREAGPEVRREQFLWSDGHTFGWSVLPYPALDVYHVTRTRDALVDSELDDEDAGFGLGFSPGLFVFGVYDQGWLKGSAQLSAFYSWTWEWLSETHRVRSWGGSFELHAGF